MSTDVNISLPAFYSRIPSNYLDVLDKEKKAISLESEEFEKRKKIRTTVTVIISAAILAVLVAGICFLLKIEPYWKWAVIYGFMLIPTIILAVKIRHTKNEKEAAVINEKAASYRRRKNAYTNNLHAYEILEKAHIKSFVYGGGHAYIQYELKDGKRKAINLEYLPYTGGDEDYPEEVMIFFKDHIEARGGVEGDLVVSTTFMGD